MFVRDLKLIRTDSTSQKYLVRKYMFAPGLKVLSWVTSQIFPMIPKSIIQLKKPIFIVGCSRSGTDIFTDLFSRHQELANWSEAAQILDLNYYDPTVDHFKDASNLANLEETRRIRAFFGLFVWQQRKERFVNKHPQNSLRLGYLKGLYPDAIFIHVIRDGRAVIASNYTTTLRTAYRAYYPFGNFPRPIMWRNYTKYSLHMQFTYQWKDIVTYVQDFASKELSVHNYFEVRYEDFCNDTFSVFQKLDQMCSLDVNKRHYSKIPRKLENQNFKWKKDLTRPQVDEIHNEIGELLEKLGYAVGQ